MTKRKVEAAFTRLDRLKSREDDGDAADVQELIRGADLFT